MRTAILVFTVTVILFVTGFTIYGMNNQNIRTNELERNTTQALEQTMENLKETKRYSVHTEEGISEWTADFIQNLLLTTNSDSSVKIQILQADASRGLLDVETMEVYDNFLGQKKETTCRKTVIFDEWMKEENDG